MELVWRHQALSAGQAVSTFLTIMLLTGGVSSPSVEERQYGGETGQHGMNVGHDS